MDEELNKKRVVKFLVIQFVLFIFMAVNVSNEAYKFHDAESGDEGEKEFYQFHNICIYWFVIVLHYFIFPVRFCIKITDIKLYDYRDLIKL